VRENEFCKVVAEVVPKELAEKMDVSTSGLVSKLIDKQFITYYCFIAFSAFTLLVGRQEGHPEGHPACKKWGDGGGGHWLVRMK